MGVGCSDHISEDKNDIKIQLQKNQKQVWYKSIRYIIANHPDFQKKKKLLSNQQCSYKLIQLSSKKQQNIANLIKEAYLVFTLQKLPEIRQLSEVINYFTKIQEQPNDTKTVFSKAYRTLSKNIQYTDLQLICYHNLCITAFDVKSNQNSALNQFILKFKSVFITQFTSKITKGIKETKFELRKKIRRSLYGFCKLCRQCIRYLYQTKQNLLCNSLFTKDNIDNLIVSVLFSQPQIYEIIYKVYEIQLQNVVHNFMKNTLEMPQSFALDQRTIQLFSKNQHSDSKINSTSQDSYKESIKILKSLISEKIPIRKLQIIYKTVIQIQHDIQNFYKQHSILRTEKLNRYNLQKVVEGLIRITNDYQLIININLTRDFIGKMYNNRKGCFIKLFMQAIGQNYE